MLGLMCNIRHFDAKHYEDQLLNQNVMSLQAAFGKNALVGFGLTTYALLGLGVV